MGTAVATVAAMAVTPEAELSMTAITDTLVGYTKHAFKKGAESTYVLFSINPQR